MVVREHVTFTSSNVRSLSRRTLSCRKIMASNAMLVVANMASCDRGLTGSNVVCGSPEFLQPSSSGGIKLRLLELDCQGKYMVVNMRSQRLGIRTVNFLSRHIVGSSSE